MLSVQESQLECAVVSHEFFSTFSASKKSCDLATKILIIAIYDIIIADITILMIKEIASLNFTE
jgi:hypothetical protein